MRSVHFTKSAHKDFLYWQEKDKRIHSRILQLLRAVRDTPFEGIGKPEALKYSLAGLWSRRIDQKHRLVYKVENHKITVISCRYHY